MLRALAITIVSFTTVACISPATRPAKIKPGFSGTVGGGIFYGAKNERECFSTCEEADVEGMSVLHFDARVGRMLGEDSAIAFGAYVAGGSTLKADIDDTPLLANGYVQTSYQTDRLALSLALEGGQNAIGPTASIQYFPNPARQHLSFQAYGRILRPFSRADVERQRSEAVKTWDAGVALRIARVLLQYSYYSRDSGVESVMFDNDAEARDWHIFVIGHEF